MYKDIGCGEVREEQVGKFFRFAGWVHKRRDHGSLIFIDLRDSKGIVQIVFDPSNSEDSHQIALSLRSEWVIEVEGTVQKRIKGAENPNLETGKVEVIATQIRILNKSKTPPFEINEEINVDENLRLKYRYLDLRKPNMQKNIKIRHSVTKAIWDYLHENDFIQIETPILIKSTPEGARDYVVPSRVHPGNFYALPQSPQQMKQILMVSGFERYFQIARCFRDEDLRADRQPEHTQLDFEMSFVEQEDVLNLAEDLYKSLIRRNFPKINLSKKFPRITFKDAIDLYGTDKPDLRFDLKLVDLTTIFSNSEFGVFKKILNSNGIIKGFVAPGCSSYSRSQISELNDFVVENGGPGVFSFTRASMKNEDLKVQDIKSAFSKYVELEKLKKTIMATNCHEDDLLLICAGSEKVVNESLSLLRKKMAEKLNLIKENTFAFAFVVDFPMFEWNVEAEKWDAMHHVFTSPKEEHIKYLDSDPGKIIGQLFDLVCNGIELGSGSIRIHNREVQEKVFNVIGYSSEEVSDRFSTILESFEYGAPPHGGMGLGLDRLVAMLVGETSIREVITFPKTQTAFDPLFETPSLISDQQLRELNFNIHNQG